MVEKKINILIAVQDKVSKTFKQINKNLDDARKRTDTLGSVFDRLRGKIMSVGFAMLFGGMAIKRFAENAIKSILKTYMDVTDQNTLASKKITQLQAAFEFLKFSIMDTIGNTELFAMFINFLIESVNAISNFVSEHPNLTLMLGVFTGLAVVIGTMMMFLGQATLGALGLVNAWSILMASPLILVLGKIALLIAIITAVIWISYNAIKSYGGVWGLLESFVVKVLDNIAYIVQETTMAIYNFFINLVENIANLLIDSKDIMTGPILLITTTIYNFFAMMWNSILDDTITSVNAFISILIGMINAFNSVVPSYMKIDTGFLKESKSFLEGMRTDMKLDILSTEEFKKRFDTGADALSEALRGPLTDFLIKARETVPDVVSKGLELILKQLGLYDTAMNVARGDTGNSFENIFRILTGQSMIGDNLNPRTGITDTDKNLTQEQNKTIIDRLTELINVTKDKDNVPIVVVPGQETSYLNDNLLTKQQQDSMLQEFLDNYMSQSTANGG